MHKGVIAVQHAGHNIPKDLVEILVAERSTYIGCMIPEVGGKGLMHVSFQGKDADENKDMILATQEQAETDVKSQGQPQVWYCGDVAGDLKDDDQQPFVVLRNANNEPLIGAFLEGDFEEEFVTAGYNHKRSTEFEVANSYLSEKIGKIFQRTRDLSETIAELKQPSTYKEMVKSLRSGPTQRMVVTFVAANGDIFSVAQNEKERSFDWGYVSQAFGYEEEKKVDTPAEKVRRGLFGGTSDKPAPVVVPEPTPGTESPKVDTPAANPSSVPTIPPKDASLGQEYKDKFFLLPNHVNNRHARKNQYKYWGGSDILNYNNGKPGDRGDWAQGTFRFQVVEKRLEEVAKALKENRLKLWDSKPIASTDPIKATSTVEESKKYFDHQDSSSTSDKPAAIHMILPVPDREKIQVLLPRVIAARSEKGELILNPEKLKEYERSVPTLAEQFGVAAGTFVPLDPEGYDLIEQINPGGTKRLFFENQSIMVSFQKENKELRDELETLKSSSSKGLFGRKTA